MSALTEKLSRIIDLQREIDLRKELYSELDRIVLELRSEGFSQADQDGLRLTLRDNFAEENTVFRPAGVKRFEITVEPIERAMRREAKRGVR